MSDVFSDSAGVAVRTTKLNQLFIGKSSNKSLTHKCLVEREGLLDALVLLHDECSNEYLTRHNKYIAQFVERSKAVIEEIRKLRISPDDFEMKRVIGRGHFGEVKLVREKVSGDVYALKTLRKNDTLSQQHVAFYEEERDIMAKACSPWITQLQYAFQDHHNLYLVMEFHPGGDLLSLLARYDDMFEEEMAVFYLAEMVLALHALHNMGFIHRDVKPDNVLIDRTGHIKLADFGSAARLAQTHMVSFKMPVGTPDYISPELLMAMNSPDGTAIYGEEVDWWSVGIVAYEMLYGTTPFTDDEGSMVATYSNIMNHKLCLVFPGDVSVSKDAVDLIKHLLTSANERLDYHQICSHRLFSTTNFPTIRQSKPPFIPTVTSQDDTSNFDNCEPMKMEPVLDDFNVRQEFSGKDLPFVGFTYNKTIQTSDRLSIASESKSPVVKNTLERKLTTRTRELNDIKERFHSLESLESSAKFEMEKLQRLLREKEVNLDKVEVERDTMEKDLAFYITEVNALKRNLELEQKARIETDNKASALLDEIKDQAEVATRLREELSQAEIEEHKEVIAQLEFDRQNLTIKISRLQKDSEKKGKECDELREKLEDAHRRFNKVNEQSRMSTCGIKEQLRRRSEETRALELEYHEKLEMILAENEQLSCDLKHLQASKMAVERELESLKGRSDSEELIQQKLQDSEQKRQSLENQLTELKKIEGIEERMAANIHEKHKRIAEMAAKVVEMEEELRKKDMALRKQERTSSRNEYLLEDKIRTLEIKLVNVNKDLYELEKQSKLQSKDTGETTKRIAELEHEKSLVESNLRLMERKMERLERAAETVQNQEKAVRDCRRLESELSDIKQEKVYMETKIANLEKQLEENQGSVEQNLGKVAELQDSLQKDREAHEKETCELKEQLVMAELESSEFDSVVNSLDKKISEMRRRISELETELGDVNRKAEQAVVKSECEKRQLETEVTMLKSCKANAENLQTKLKDKSEELFTLRQENRRMKTDLDNLNGEKGRHESDMKVINSQLTERKRKCETQEQKIRELEHTNQQLESQNNDLTKLVRELEDRESEWNRAKKVYETAVEELEEQNDQTYQQLNCEKQSKESIAGKTQDLKGQMKTLMAKGDSLKKQLQEKAHMVQKLNKELTEVEKKNSMLDLNLKTVSRKLEAALGENHQLKEETSRLITETKVLKASNFTISQNLEEAMDKYDHLNLEKEELENQLESLKVNYEHEKFKLDSHLSQQGKLIDFLQAKAETPSKKKKGFKSKENAPATPNVKPMQWKDMQNMLEMERSRNAQLQQQISKLRADLHQAKTEALKSKGRSSCRQCEQVSGPMTPNSNAAMSALVMSPSKQASSLSLLTPARNPSIKRPPATPTPSRPSKERMHHKIPHRFVTGLNTRATKCAVCLGTVHFVKQAAKCQECHAVCHPKCASSLPATCGLPTQYMKHFTEFMAKKAASPARNLSMADLDSLDLCGWMKVPKSGKQALGGWEKKWVNLEDNRLCIYNKGTNDNNPIDTFNLFPVDADVTVSSAVTTSELVNTASTDLPYIMKIETRQKNSSLPGRSLYMMALSFPEKQKWVATLEALVSEQCYDNDSYVRLTGDTLLHLGGSRRLDVNCALLLSDQLILMGTEEGLFAQKLHDPNKEPAVGIGGLDSVYQMTELVEKGLVVIIAGKGRNLYTVEMKTLKSRVEQGFILQPVSILAKHIDKMTHCTVFDCGVYDNAAYICTGTPDQIYILKYNYGLSSFCIRKELPTTEPCSCIEFGDGHVIVGTDKFYSIELDHYNMTEFLDKTDSSLAFAVYGAATYDSYPLAVHQIAARPEEYLLCFHEFGVFVDSLGKRSRQDDLKWDGLPLGFAHHSPYLYVVHFNSIQVIDITIAEAHLRCRWASLDIPNPRFIGAALSDQSVYISSNHNEVTDIIGLKVVTLDESCISLESKENLPTYPSTSSVASSIASSYKSPTRRKATGGLTGSTLRLSYRKRIGTNPLNSAKAHLEYEDDSPPKRKKKTTDL
ncbi:citron rho-interacting kinase-like [Lineus longissimus]|uniref:citron rho-interacting kinase-like n=1 Tax=Lineus longissimus TaxID=88925 RepID=UPI00315CBB8E